MKWWHWVALTAGGWAAWRTMEATTNGVPVARALANPFRSIDSLKTTAATTWSPSSGWSDPNIVRARV